MESILDKGSKLGNLIKSKLNGLRGDKMGENFLYWIDNPKFDTPEDGYKLLREFINKCLQECPHEADLYRSFPFVFHENTYKNIDDGMELYKEILAEL